MYTEKQIKLKNQKTVDDIALKLLKGDYRILEIEQTLHGETNLRIELVSGKQTVEINTNYLHDFIF